MAKVRRIRSELERRGHTSLLFFLKCPEADDVRLPELIRDEIKARTFFVLCNTRVSRRSKWVKQEIERVKQVTQRPRQTVVVMTQKGFADGASHARRPLAIVGHLAHLPVQLQRQRLDPLAQFLGDLGDLGVLLEQFHDLG